MQAVNRSVYEDNNIESTGESLMTAQEVADFLKVKKSSVRKWSREGKLKGFRLGNTGDWRYSRADVRSFLRGREL